MTLVAISKRRSHLLRGALVLLTALFLVLSLCACVNEETKTRMRTHCETVLDALIAGDIDTAYSVLQAAGSREQMEEFALQLQPMLAGVTDYELKQSGWHIQTEQGVTVTTLTYWMTCSDGTQLSVEISETSGIEGLTGFFISAPEQEVANGAPLALRLVFLGFSLLVFAFCIWMIVDCARRKIRYKALWIILILAAITLTVRIYGGQFGGIEARLGLTAALSSIHLDAVHRHCTSRVIVPVGAILYCILRRRLTVTPPAPESTDDTWTAPEQDGKNE